MTATEKLIDIATLDRNLAAWIDEARKSGMSDDVILNAIRRVMRMVEATKVRAA